MTEPISEFELERKIQIDVIRLSWKRREERNWFYHGTQERHLEAILKEGLRPSCETGNVNYASLSDEHSVYITTEKCMAVDFAHSSIRLKLDGSREKVFLIKIPKSSIPREKLLGDENLNGSDGPSFRIEGNLEGPFLVHEIIKPSVWSC